MLVALKLYILFAVKVPKRGHIRGKYKKSTEPVHP